MGSGSRARSRGFKPKDNFAVEESHRVSGSPPKDASSVRRMDAAPSMPGSSGKCHACSAALSDARPVHLSAGHASDASALGVDGRVFADATACRACGRGGVASASTTPPSSSPPSPLAKSAEYLLERYAERRALSLGGEGGGAGGGGRAGVLGNDAGVGERAKRPATANAQPGGASSDRRFDEKTTESAPSSSTREKSETSRAACDACVACGDTCGVAGCSTCGGTPASVDVDVELAERDDDGVSAAAAAAAAEAAAIAAANPRRDGWGRDGPPPSDASSTTLFTMDDLPSLSSFSGVSRGAEGEKGETEKRKQASRTRATRTFSCCEVLRRRAGGRALLVAHGNVYDASLFLADHPVGPLPILRGLGRDNTEDMQMHSAAAQRAWGKLKIGVLRPCPKRAFGPFAPPKGRYESCVVS